MKILYLTSTRFPTTPWRDASTRYRCFHFAEDLRALGHHADVASLDDIDLSKLRDYAVVSVLRPVQSQRLNAVLTTCKRHGLITVADFDDLVFSPEHAKQAPGVINHQTTVQHLKRRFEQHLKALVQFDLVTTATQALADHVERLHPDACVQTLPNGLSDYWLKANAEINLPEVMQCRQAEKRITYLPGTRSHAADFKCVEAVLAQLLENNRNLRLRIVGNLEFDRSGFNGAQLELLPWVDYSLLPTISATSFVTIAPLCNTEFNACKSHIKFIESAVFGTPVISSPNPDVERHLSCDGLLVAHNSEDWKQAFNSLLDSKHYKTKCTNALDYARKKCLNRVGAEQFLLFLEAQIKRRDHEHSAAISAAG